MSSDGLLLIRMDQRVISRGAVASSKTVAVARAAVVVAVAVAVGSRLVLNFRPLLPSLYWPCSHPCPCPHPCSCPCACRALVDWPFRVLLMSGLTGLCVLLMGGAIGVSVPCLWVG